AVQAALLVRHAPTGQLQAPGGGGAVARGVGAGAGPQDARPPAGDCRVGVHRRGLRLRGGGPALPAARDAQGGARRGGGREGGADAQGGGAGGAGGRGVKGGRRGGAGVKRLKFKKNT